MDNATSGTELTVEEFVSLCQQMRTLGVARFTFAGQEVVFFPPEPTHFTLEERAPEVEQETSGSKRENIQREMRRHEGDLYGAV